MRRNANHLKRSLLSFLSGQKIYLVGDTAEIDAVTTLADALVADADALIEHPFGDRLAAFVTGLQQLRRLTGTARILVDNSKAIDGFAELLESLEQIFGAIGHRDIDQVARLTNSNPAFISAWGMPNHFLVLRKRFAAQQALPC